MFPDRKGYFGAFGGRFVPETLMAALSALDEYYCIAKKTLSLRKNLHIILGNMQAGPRRFIMRKT